MFDLLLCQSQTVSAMTSRRRIKPRFSGWSKYNAEWLSLSSIGSESNVLLFYRGSVFGVSIHYPHQASNAWCAPQTETFHCHDVYRKQHCLVNFTGLEMLIAKLFYWYVCRAWNTDVWTLRLNGNSKGNFGGFFLIKNFLCMYFFFEYRAVLMHVNYLVWPSGHLSFRSCKLEHLASAADTKAMTFSLEKGLWSLVWRT